MFELTQSITEEPTRQQNDVLAKEALLLGMLMVISTTDDQNISSLIQEVM